MSYCPKRESIEAYKRMIEHFRREIAKLEGEIFTEICCFEKTNKDKIFLPITNKPKITK
jgi:hypothetical protein